jgi:fosfomycin resistance protein FosX
MIRGISHITLIVRDLSRMADILVEGLGGEEIYDSGARQFSVSREKFFIVGGVWIAAMEGEPLAERTYNHVAFAVDDADLDQYEARLAALGLEFRPPRPRVAGEGRSLYFHDDDNHLFELHSGTLDARLARYRAEPGG